MWPGKATLWEMTCLLGADWYVIPQAQETDYHRNLLTKHPRLREIVSKWVKNVVSPEEIPFDEYDVVITFDPILSTSDSSHTLLAYYLNEHWDRLYKQSLQRPIGNYDLFLAHMMDAETDVISLPQAISFPYLRAPDVVRSVFNSEKEETVWVDWRTLTTLSLTERWSCEAEKAANRLQETLAIPVCYYGDFNQSPYGVFDPPKWGDAVHYLERLGRCKYYIAVGRASGAGQGLCDAASLSCICIGEQDKAFHSLVCHPACLCADMVEMPRRIRQVVSSLALQEEVLHWQDNMLREHFANRPLAVLEKAIAMRRGRLMSEQAVAW